MLHGKKEMFLFGTLLSLLIFAKMNMPYSDSANVFIPQSVYSKVEVGNQIRDVGYPGLLAGTSLAEDFAHYGIASKIMGSAWEEAGQAFEEESEPVLQLALADALIPQNPYWEISFSMEDHLALERIVEAEAGGEDELGKILVAQVVLNRVLDENFPDSATEVIFERIGSAIQFTPTVDGRYHTVVVSEETRQAVEQALYGEDVSEGALYFSARKMANPKAMNWFDQNLKRLFQHGGHEFYTLP